MSVCLFVAYCLFCRVIKKVAMMIGLKFCARFFICFLNHPIYIGDNLPRIVLREIYRRFFIIFKSSCLSCFLKNQCSTTLGCILKAQVENFIKKLEHCIEKVYCQCRWQRIRYSNCFIIIN